MRFEVPQFIEIEDKIIGPLTWKQFVYLAGGIGMLVIAKFLLPFIFFLFIGLPLGILAASLAFHRVNNRPFATFLESFTQYITHGKLYVWKKSTMQSIVQKKESVLLQEKSVAPTNKNALNKLEQYLEHKARER